MSLYESEASEATDTGTVYLSLVMSFEASCQNNTKKLEVDAICPIASRAQLSIMKILRFNGRMITNSNHNYLTNKQFIIKK